jgi:capsular polysaccharide biosynthesis protein
MKFEHYRVQILRPASNVSFAQTSPELLTLRPPPRFVFGPIPRKFPEWFFGDRGAPETGMITIANAEVFGDRILSDGGEGIYIPQCGIHAESVASEAARREAFTGGEIIELKGEWVLLSGVAYQMYGHWLIDFMPRLINLIATGREISQCRYLLPGDLPDFARAWLTLLGIPPENISYYDLRAHVYHVETALIPVGLRVAARVNPLMSSALAWVRNVVLPADMPEPPGRSLFVSRRKWGNTSRTLMNEDEIIDIALRYGFSVVYPEELSLVEQVQVFASAKVILGDYGSALHNAIFAPRDVTVIALRGTEGHPGFLQSGLCEVLNQDMGYVFGDTTQTESSQSYRISLEDLKLCLELVSLKKSRRSIDEINSSYSD